MIGHKKIWKELTALAESGDLGHGYVFFGPAMVGKRTFARELAEYFEKASSAGPGAILSDFMLVEPLAGAGSIGIDAARGIRNFLWQKPNMSLRRTLVIDDAELLTAEAQNALLKVTEEPPASSLLILITSDIESVMPTILSRLPKIYFGAVPEKDIEPRRRQNVRSASLVSPGACSTILLSRSSSNPRKNFWTHRRRRGAMS
jgi:DNA polymerase III gamma/tau subunit